MRKLLLALLLAPFAAVAGGADCKRHLAPLLVPVAGAEVAHAVHDGGGHQGHAAHETGCKSQHENCCAEGKHECCKEHAAGTSRGDHAAAGQACCSDGGQCCKGANAKCCAAKVAKTKSGAKVNFKVRKGEGCEDSTVPLSELIVPLDEPGPGGPANSEPMIAKGHGHE